jgi:hypothetical protein
MLWNKIITVCANSRWTSILIHIFTFPSLVRFLCSPSREQMVAYCMGYNYALIIIAHASVDYIVE